MTCPKCDGNAIVVDSKSDCDAVYRKRKCAVCNYTFYTEEVESIDAQRLFNRLSNEYRKERKKKGSKQNAKSCRN